MDAATARSTAQQIHRDQRTRSGSLVTEHLERVAAAVPPDARAVAFLHDVLERSSTAIAELVAAGLTALELEALRMLTRDPAESYELHVLDIAHADGASGVLARVVKLADLDDHLMEAPVAFDGPPYAWARRHIAAARERDECRRVAAA